MRKSYATVTRSPTLSFDSFAIYFGISVEDLFQELIPGPLGGVMMNADNPRYVDLATAV